jgi:hypothetical protein
MLEFEPIEARMTGLLGKITVPVTRASIPGGWLVTVVYPGQSASVCFVPDPEHCWDGSSIQDVKAAK